MRCSDEQWTLGMLIDALEKRPADQDVRFDFGYMVPANVSSYRGYYEDLAISFAHCNERENNSVGRTLEGLRAAVGKVFTGYKGGNYRADRDTALWVANYGESGGTAVVGVAEECDYVTIIRTKWID